MTYQDFTRSERGRQRYWARSHVGWHRMARAEPNEGHRALAALGRAGLVTSVVTQNVDELHQAAGSPGVVDLHGTLSQVVCLGCRELTPRVRLHERLAALNPGWAERDDLGSADIAPDGDVDLDDTAGFVVAPCERCGGVLKPDVVFFGENVPVERVERCYSLVEAARVLLVAGTSCTVFSGPPLRRPGRPRGHPCRRRQPRTDPGRRPGDGAPGRGLLPGAVGLGLRLTATAA